MVLKGLFDVETLDFRFGAKDPTPLPTAKPSKWKTTEFYIYYVFHVVFPFLMTKAVYDVSKTEHPNYPRIEPLLSTGWIPGRKVDNSDTQYKGFRDNIPYMALVVLLHPLLRRAYESFQSRRDLQHANGANHREDDIGIRTANARMESRITFDLAFACIFLLVLHGISAFKILLILYFNWQIATKLPKQYVSIATWTFNIGILFANELCRGYQFHKLASAILSLTTHRGDLARRGWNFSVWLDGFGGLIPRWEVLFNITVLRLIAFNFDRLWMLDRRSSSPLEKKNLDPSHMPEKERVQLGAKPEDFTFRNYLAYTLYSPLYLAGPIVNFNDYISQLRYPLPCITRARIIPYAIRFAFCLLFMEVLLHFLYVVAIFNSNPDWNTYTPFQLSMLAYFNVHVIWLKLLLPWRFFRLWGLLDGIDAPENMVRCASNVPSTLAFWRGWHRSFNLWVMRYIYLPLGGSRVGKARAVRNFLAVFTFVALWHDINLRLLAWGWLVVLFVLPEVIGNLLFPVRKWQDWPNTYRWLRGLGSVSNCWLMMVANLVGFAIGVDGLKGLVVGILDTLGGRLYLLGAYIVVFAATQVMFEVREDEKRRGVSMKC